MPYYKNGGEISKWEKVTKHNIEKYIKLSNDDIETYYHTPDKILIFIIKFPELDKSRITNKQEYNQFYLSNTDTISLSKKDYGEFGDVVVFNDYEKFIEKIYHHIKSI